MYINQILSKAKTKVVNKLKNTIRKTVSDDLYEIFEINYHCYQKNYPIVIYTMGKVGSTTVYSSLKTQLKNPVYHVHFLQLNEIKRIEEKYRNYNSELVNSPIITKGKFLNRAINSRSFYSSSIRWKIISLIREPILTELSHLFHNPRLHHPYLLNDKGEIDSTRALEVATNKLSNYSEEKNYIANWFSRELNKFLGIDIYKYDFDHNKGYSIIQFDKFDILLLRLETLDECFTESLQELLEKKITSINLKTSNINEGKEFSSFYKYVREEISIPLDICEKIYSSKYAQHFYTKQMILDFIGKWSKKY